MKTDGLDDVSQMGYKRETLHEPDDTCENCYQPMPAGSGELVQVVNYFGKTQTLNVCEACRVPVELEIVWLHSRLQYWIYYTQGLGRFHKTVEAWGDSKEEVIENFKQKYCEVLDRDLINLKIKS